MPDCENEALKGIWGVVVGKVAPKGNALVGEVRISILSEMKTDSARRALGLGLKKSRVDERRKQSSV